jgi:FKBP-type peptidyl-prolyl cis-trans isomerase (trigger factor)
MFETYEVAFEIYIEDKLVNKQAMQAPRAMIEASFIQTVNQIARDKRPMKIRMSRRETIWDNFENKQKSIENEVVFGNSAMITWEENNKGET